MAPRIHRHRKPAYSAHSLQTDSPSRDVLACSQDPEHNKIRGHVPNPCWRTGMSSLTAGKHAGSGAASNQPAVAEPTFAERARTLVHVGRVGSLSTHSRKQQGFPFGSVMPYGLDDQANPVFLISTMAMHTQNVQADPRSSLLVAQPDAIGDPLGASRVTLLGNILPVPAPEVAGARKLYLARHANSKYWVDFDDFSFYRMGVVDVYYVGGFGVMGWVSAPEYYSGQ